MACKSALEIKQPPKRSSHKSVHRVEPLLAAIMGMIRVVWFRMPPRELTTHIWYPYPSKNETSADYSALVTLFDYFNSSCAPYLYSQPFVSCHWQERCSAVNPLRAEAPCSLCSCVPISKISVQQLSCHFPALLYVAQG